MGSADPDHLWSQVSGRSRSRGRKFDLLKFDLISMFSILYTLPTCLYMIYMMFEHYIVHHIHVYLTINLDFGRYTCDLDP